MGFKFWYVSMFGIGIWLKYKVVLIWIFKESLSFIWNNISSYSLNNLIFIVSGRNVKYIMKWLYVIYVLEMFYNFYGINVILL